MFCVDFIEIYLLLSECNITIVPSELLMIY